MTVYKTKYHKSFLPHQDPWEISANINNFLDSLQLILSQTLFEVENPRVSFGNNLKKKNIEIKCTSNGETIPKENINITTNEQTNVTTYGVPGLRLRLTYQPIISFKYLFTIYNGSTLIFS